MIDVFAPAKINLTLHVTGRRSDGYHLLDSLVVFGDIGDKLSVRASDHLSLEVTGPFAEGVPTDDTNLVMRAAKLLDRERGAAITLEKHLPHGGGIGGGSSDAAAALKALSALWDVPPITEQAALSLGADLPVCMRAPHPTFMSGIGEGLRPTPALPKIWIVLVNPRVSVSTADVFRTLADTYGVDNPKMDPLEERLNEDEFWIWLSGQRNDLTVCAAELAPQINECIGALWNFDGCQDADMSGSGSTCRGVFASHQEAEEAASTLQSSYPNWWIRVTEIS